MIAPAHTVPFRILFRSPLLSIHDYHCHRHDTGLTQEYEARFAAVVFPRRGVFIKQVQGESVVADVNHALFFNPSETYRFRHPCGCGDRVTEIVPDEDVLRDLAQSIDPALADCARRPFLERQAPFDAGGWMLHRLLMDGLSRGDGPDALEVEELGLHLVGRAMRSGHERRGARPGAGRRGDTRQAHAELVARTRLLLAGRFGEAHSIDSIAREVASSPYHLCRVFKRRTGMTIHRYLSQVRLRAGVDRVLDAGPDLTRLAFDLGFSSHSHFTCSFRREFGVTPSAVRDSRDPGALRQLSKTLTASAGG